LMHVLLAIEEGRHTWIWLSNLPIRNQSQYEDAEIIQYQFGSTLTFQNFLLILSKILLRYHFKPIVQKLYQVSLDDFSRRDAIESLLQTKFGNSSQFSAKIQLKKLEST